MKKNTWISISKDCCDELLSDPIQRFIWRESDSYNYGQLIVKFEDSSYVYSYDLKYDYFKELAKRANNYSKYQETVFQLYDSKMVEWVDKTSGTLYKERYDVK